MATDNRAEQNFLIPNGTFFAELAIFLLVLAVIWLFVVPPIRDVLAEREARVTKTATDEQRARELFGAAEHRYRSSVSQARSEAARLRAQARLDGRAILISTREHAQEQSDEMVAAAAIQLRAQADAVAAGLREHIDPLAGELAERVIGGDGERT
ncbi:F0F1 ATP synthase subunit B [Nocardia abscessus]|uniref:F0F1 ATP synthase subunit B family protein n=1 Tax=Nocardia TaxID=1817 RepID=UPI0018951C39|nr:MULTISPECIES: F0F1 ATP synthase subunit B [Nocardia]MBF6220721.1 F0F1 ATP synthase subunit B [Nocardia abscessus]MDE1672001.1 F0F1 ATP synthase subunit B [Nocardia gipuzkoensis]